MKINSFTQSLVVAALSAVVLSSCQVSLMSAVEQGDVVAVRKAIATGVQPGELNAAASVAYFKGDSAILDELLKSGAVAAPDSVAHKKIVFQTNWRWSDDDYSYERPDVSTLSLFVQYWNSKDAQHVWEKDTSGDIHSIHSVDGDSGTGLAWGDENLIKGKESSGDGEDYMENNYQLEYKRIGVNTAFLTYDFSHMRMSRSYESHAYYFLTFETPTSGTFKCLDREVLYFGYEHWTSGRFWLKDAPQEPKKETKKVGKKKRK